MSEEREVDPKAILESITQPEPVDLDTPFAKSLGAALREGVASMRGAGVIEMKDEDVDSLIAELTEVALDSSSRKKLLRRVVYSLVHSDHVEEVYETDEAISTVFRGFLEGE